MRPVRRRTLIWIVVALALLAGILAPPMAASDHRLVAHVSEPFAVSGEVCPAGKLSLREVMRYTPASSLIEVRAGGEFVGLFVAERCTGAPEDEGASLYFERDRDERLVLVAFSFRGESGGQLHRFRTGDRATRPVRLAER